MIQALAGTLLRRVITGSNASGPPVDFNVNLTINEVEFLRRLDGKRRQIPYAISLGLNKTAEKVRDAEVSELHKVFDIRSPWWKSGKRYGINVKPAKKRGKEAKVFTRATWLEDHVVGNTRYPRNRHRAVPKSARIRRKTTGGINKTWHPATLKGAFEIPFKKAGFAGLFVRKGRKRQMEFMYLLIPQAKIKETYDWYGVGNKAVKKHANAAFSAAIRQTLATAK